MFLSAIPVIGKVLEGIIGVVDKCVEDKDEAARLKAELQMQALQLDYTSINTEVQAQAAIIAAEAQGQSTLQRNWRPILMLTIVAIVANNYLVFPYIKLFSPQYALSLDLPNELWNLMSIGVGGYIFGRSGEKIASVFKK